MKNGFERTLIVVKPEGVQSHNVGEIVGRFEKSGLKLVGLKLVQVTDELVAKHYTADNKEWMRSVGEKQKTACESRGEKFPFENVEDFGMELINRLRRHIVESPVVAMVLEGPSAIKLGRKITGITEPASAAPGTIRGDLICDTYNFADKSGRSVR
ncbi:MAG: nucleoside-diphosphate kinase, partial [Candidatus Diapherotrites archaeon]|nr:nucleoside-diphosphate kinase [Candidatus Diapherotrites archaeon]